MLNTIDAFLKEMKVKFMRIDGSTSLEHRNRNVEAFQREESIKVALLSITACATGLTLTAASNVVFSEMYYTPSTMIQAEDRAHRIGQENTCVNIHYLYGEGTCDYLIYKLLMDKFAVCENALDNTNKGMNVEVQGKKKSLKPVNELGDRIKENKGESLAMVSFLGDKSKLTVLKRVDTPERNKCDIDDDFIDMFLCSDEKKVIKLEEEKKL